MTTKIKSGVQLYGVRPEMVVVHVTVASVFARHSIDCVVTSAVGMKHSKRSLHPVGFAKDYRTKHIDKFLKRKILEELKQALPCCDIVLEHEGQPQEHIHVEFDPKDDLQFQEDKDYYKKHGEWKF